MNTIAHLIHDDMFLAVVSYLSIGLVCLLYFFYREKKWERDLAQFEIKPVFDHESSTPSYRPGTFSINHNSNKLVAVVALNEEMQVVAGQPLEPETALEYLGGIAQDSSGKQPSATILPFKRRRQDASANSRHHGG